MKPTNLVLLFAVAMLVVGSGTANAAIVAQYSFEDNLLDSAPGGTVDDDLTYVKDGSASTVAQYVTGVVGKAGTFDGNLFSALDSVDLGLNDNTWTIEAFISATSVGGFNRLVLKWDTAPYEYHVTLRDGDFDLFDSSVTEVFKANTTPATDFTDGDWHHVAVTSSAAGAEAWIDGTSVWTGDAVTLVESDNLLGLGNSGGGAGSSRYLGLMDEVLIHDSAVDQTYIDGRVGLIPEPSSMALAALGFLCLGWYFRCRHGRSR